jgi:hypothetical protein
MLTGTSTPWGSGGAAVLQHAWLKDTPWDELKAQTFPAPWVPNVQSKLDEIKQNSSDALPARTITGEFRQVKKRDSSARVEYNQSLRGENEPIVDESRSPAKVMSPAPTERSISRMASEMSVKLVGGKPAPELHSVPVLRRLGSNVHEPFYAYLYNTELSERDQKAISRYRRQDLKSLPTIPPPDADWKTASGSRRSIMRSLVTS